MQYRRVLDVTVVVSMAFALVLLLGISFASADEERGDRGERADRSGRTERPENDYARPPRSPRGERGGSSEGPPLEK